ncbi:hypothetical protein BZA70DRAFT_266772 [Myxozyma melibiosi]|uniref:Uncharacterized protein n=1 Tax=Myxozyma melibiosi TaxID=54550 RepID=A0ABR1F720_9ASCO
MVYGRTLIRKQRFGCRLTADELAVVRSFREKERERMRRRRERRLTSPTDYFSYDHSPADTSPLSSTPSASDSICPCPEPAVSGFQSDSESDLQDQDPSEDHATYPQSTFTDPDFTLQEQTFPECAALDVNIDVNYVHHHESPGSPGSSTAAFLTRNLADGSGSTRTVELAQECHNKSLFCLCTYQAITRTPMIDLNAPSNKEGTEVCLCAYWHPWDMKCDEPLASGLRLPALDTEVNSASSFANSVVSSLASYSVETSDLEPSVFRRTLIADQEFLLSVSAYPELAESKSPATQDFADANPRTLPDDDDDLAEAKENLRSILMTLNSERPSAAADLRSWIMELLDSGTGVSMDKKDSG